MFCSNQTDNESCVINPNSPQCSSSDHKEESFYEKITSNMFSEGISTDFNELYTLIAVLSVTGATVVIFLWGYIFIDKRRRETPLVARVNELEKQLLLTTKENTMLRNKLEESPDLDQLDGVTSEELESLREELLGAMVVRQALEDQIQTLEKELENSTEVGLELNRMLSEILSSQNGSDTLIANVEQLQRQLVEQQSTINSLNETLNEKDTENHELQLEMEICNRKVVDLQSELDKMVLNMLKVEEEKENLQSKLEGKLVALREDLESLSKNTANEQTKYLDEIKMLTNKCNELRRSLDVKINEYNLLKEGLKEVKGAKVDIEAVKSLVDMSSLKAELQQLQRDNKTLAEHLKIEEQNKYTLQSRVDTMVEELNVVRSKYDDADREKLEAQTKLEVLSNYFTEREAQLQKLVRTFQYCDFIISLD